MTAVSVLQKIVDQLVSDIRAVTLSVNGETVTLSAGAGIGKWPTVGAGVDVELTVGPAYENQDCNSRIDYTHEVNLRFRGTSPDVTMLALETVRVLWYPVAARATLAALQVLSFLPGPADPPVPFRQGNGNGTLCDQRFNLRIEYQYL